ncbi:MAG: hypothetical protein WBM08_15150 [Prochlorococcaceae cyanobacterium]
MAFTRVSGRFSLRALALPLLLAGALVAPLAVVLMVEAPAAAQSARPRPKPSAPKAGGNSGNASSGNGTAAFGNQ